MRHEGTVKGRGQAEARDIADCGFRPGAAYSPEGLRIAELTAKNTARPAAIKAGLTAKIAEKKHPKSLSPVQGRFPYLRQGARSAGQ